jgi:predicted NAD/FAD-dependent oxidoreductase
MKPFVVWNGLAEFKEELRQLPEACTVEAAHLIEGEVNSAYVAISQVYGAHHFTGTLQKKLTKTLLNETQFATGWKLTSGSPLAWLFDNGSQARHYTTPSGAVHQTGAMWGRTPPTHIFSSTVGKTKRALVQKLKEMVLRHGASTVSDGG